MADEGGIVNLYDELPSWSNQENRDKHAEILRNQAELQQTSTACKELSERVAVLTEHLKNVQTEVTTTQQLLTAKEVQVEEEKHLAQLILREKGKIESELVSLEEKTTDIQAKWSEVQAKTFKSQQRIEVMKEQAKMNQQDLEQWIVIARQKEEDFLVLQRYQREDEGRIRSMLLEIEKATGIIEGKRAELENEVTATRALQIELDMTAEHFRKMHEERAQLLQQWENTMKQMQQLNQSIEQSTANFDSRKEEVEKLQLSVSEEKRKLDQAESENQSIDRQVTIGDHKVSQLHKQLEKDEHDLSEFKETVETQRHQLDKLENDERAYKEQIEDFQRKTAEEDDKRKRFLERLAETEKALATQKDTTGEYDEQTNLMNQFLKKEEGTLKSLIQEIDAGKQSIFKLSQEVSEVKKKEADLRAELQGSQSRAKNLQSKIQDFDRETQKQMELVYNSNFQIQQMERKIARIEGERTEEEKIELQAQIEQLSGILDQKLETEKTLNLQLHRLELDLRQTSRKKERLKEAKETLEVKLNEIRLDQDSLDKSMVKARTEKESVLVQLNILRLQVEKLTEQVNMKADELISLENRRQQLQLSMEERLLEIDGHINALRTQLKTEEEARHTASIELKERIKRAETLEAKYQVMMGKYQVDGEEASQSYHVIQFAKERDEVTRRGDELEAEVKKALRELRQLEKSMAEMNSKNSDFRKNFTAVSENDNDMERKKILEEQVRVAQQCLNARRAEAHANAEERAARQATYDQHEHEIEQIQKDIQKLKPSFDRLGTENAELKEKITRASKMLTKAKEKHRVDSGVAADTKYPSTLLEMDIELRMAKASVEAAAADIQRAAEANLETKPKIKLAFTQIGIPFKEGDGGTKMRTMMDNAAARSKGAIKSPASSNRSSMSSVASRASGAPSRSGSATSSSLSIQSIGSRPISNRSSASSIGSNNSRASRSSFKH